MGFPCARALTLLLMLTACRGQRDNLGHRSAGNSIPDGGVGNTTFPGPPRIVAAFVIYDGLDTTCDLADARSWGGNFAAHPRCVPDLLDPTDAARTHPPMSSLRVVFSEKLDPSKIATNYGRLGGGPMKPGIVTASSGSITVAIEPFLNYYDTRGRDFRQGLVGTRWPGPSLWFRFGDQTAGLGAPTSSTTQTCFMASAFTDLGGDPLADPLCIGFHADALRAIQFSPPDGGTVSLSALGTVGVAFNAPLATASVSTSNVSIALANSSLPSNCYSVSQFAASGSLSIGIQQSCAVSGPATVTFRGSLADRYGIPMGADQVWHFTVTP